MKSRVLRGAAVGAAGVVVAGVGVAFGAVTGSGATFPRVAYENWCRDSGICSYTAKGSGGGINDFINGVVDFAASDATLTQQQLSDLSSKRGGVSPLYFPTLLGAVTVPVNIGGVSGNAVRLDGKVVGDIFDGTVKTWNDAKIKKTNPKAALPSAPITVCVRADGSGTTFNFSRYLSKVNSGFKSQVSFGQTVPWSAPNLIKSPGNAGVANCVKNNQNSIGYVDLADAINAGLAGNITSIGRSQVVKKGKRSVRKTVFVRPSIASIQAAGQLKALKPDLTIDFSASPNPGAYPIAITTWILAYSNYGSAGKTSSLNDVKSFLTYAYGKAAQDKLASLGFAPLPANVLAAAKKQLAQLK